MATCIRDLLSRSCIHITMQHHHKSKTNNPNIRTTLTGIIAPKPTSVMSIYVKSVFWTQQTGISPKISARNSSHLPLASSLSSLFPCQTMSWNSHFRWSIATSSSAHQTGEYSPSSKTSRCGVCHQHELKTPGLETSLVSIKVVA
jgi:hypothetical protein